MITREVKSMHKKILLGIFVLLLAAGALTWYIFTEKFTDTAERKADHTVNAMNLLKEFRINDSLANKKYTEKIVTVKGKVSEIEAVDSTVNIKMSDTATGDYIIFAFQQQHLTEAKTLKAGDEVAIKGSCSGGIYSRILETRYVSFKRATLDK